MLRSSATVAGIAASAVLLATAPADARPYPYQDPPFTHQDLRSPDTRDAAEAVRTNHPTTYGPIRQDLRSPDAQDAARGVVVGAATTTTSSPGTPAKATSGFDWSDAAIGAGASFALVLVLAGGGMVVVRRSGHRPLHTAASPR